MLLKRNPAIANSDIVGSLSCDQSRPIIAIHLPLGERRSRELRASGRSQPAFWRPLLFFVTFFKIPAQSWRPRGQTNTHHKSAMLLDIWLFPLCFKIVANLVRGVSPLPACGSWTLSSPAGALTASLGLRRSLVLVMHAVEVKCDFRVGRERRAGGGGRRSWTHPSPCTTCLFELTADFIGVSPVAAMEPGEPREWPAFMPRTKERQEIQI